jgi:hypothetical protein
VPDMDRRSVLVVGLAAASAFAWPKSARAATYGPNEGKEVAPGVRVVALTDRAAVIPGYKTVKMRDLVFQPGAKFPNTLMKNDMLCHLTEGELLVTQGDQQFTVKTNDVWTCAKGTTTEGSTNTGRTVAVMRVIDLMPA